MLLSFKSLTNARGGTRESALSRFSSCFAGYSLVYTAGKTNVCFAAACSLLLTRIAPRFRALTILPHIRISCSLRYTFISLWGGWHSRIRTVALLILLRRIFARLYRGKNKCLLRSRLFAPAYTDCSALPRSHNPSPYSHIV